MARVLAPQRDVRAASVVMGRVLMEQYRLYGILCLQCYLFFQGSSTQAQKPLVKYSVGGYVQVGGGWRSAVGRSLFCFC